MDWPIVTVYGIGIIASAASFTKIVTSRKNNNPGTLRTVADCDKNMVPIQSDIKDIKKSIVGIEKHLSNLDGWLMRNGKIK